MQPFYQGKIDTFCAVYAVLNALQILHGITPAQARELFNEVLVRESRNEVRFRDVLAHRTDYVDLVDQMLEAVRPRYPLIIRAPFASGTPHAEVWNALVEYAAPERRRTGVFRFLRYVPLRDTPVVDHWTTARDVDKSGLHLFESGTRRGVLPARRRAGRSGGVAPSRVFRDSARVRAPAVFALTSPSNPVSRHAAFDLSAENGRGRPDYGLQRAAFTAYGAAAR